MVVAALVAFFGIAQTLADEDVRVMAMVDVCSQIVSSALIRPSSFELKKSMGGSTGDVTWDDYIDAREKAESFFDPKDSETVESARKIFDLRTPIHQDAVFLTFSGMNGLGGFTENEAMCTYWYGDNEPMTRQLATVIIGDRPLGKYDGDWHAAKRLKYGDTLEVGSMDKLILLWQKATNK